VSFAQQTGISIALFRPSIDAGTSYDPRGTLVREDLGTRVEMYEHTLSVNNGYFRARFVIKDDVLELERWMDRIGYHVEVSGSGLDLIWEGFVNRIALNIGPVSFTRGPLTDVGNKVAVVYSELDTTADEPVFGMRQKSPYVEDSTSQDTYGVIEKIISVGGARPVNARQVRDTWLTENAEPMTTQEFNNQAHAEPSVTVECVGYWWFLKAFTWNQIANSGTRGISDQVQDVLAGDPNGLFSTDYSQIESNTLAIKRYTDEDNTAWDWLIGLVAHGDVNDNRYIFGIYANRRAVYAQQESSIEYVQRLSEARYQVDTLRGIEVKPWNVVPAKWLFYPDFLRGEVIHTTMRLDPRYEFIEQVIYTAPEGLRHYGGRSDTLPQKLAKLGLGGSAV